MIFNDTTKIVSHQKKWRPSLMYEKIKLNDMENVDCFVDVEVLRIEKLIEEREIYEEQFLSMENTLQCDKLDYSIAQYEKEIEKQEILASRFQDFGDGLFNPFGYEDYLMEKRDEELIEEREKYESDYFAIVDESLVFNDIFDFQIRSRERDEFIERNGYDYDFKYEPEDEPDYAYDEYEEEMFWHLHYLRESQFASQSTCGCEYLDYMPHDDGLCDYLDCYDYPEGPDENLCGVKYY